MQRRHATEREPPATKASHHRGTPAPPRAATHPIYVVGRPAQDGQLSPSRRPGPAPPQAFGAHGGPVRCRRHTRHDPRPARGSGTAPPGLPPNVNPKPSNASLRPPPPQGMHWKGGGPPPPPSGQPASVPLTPMAFVTDGNRSQPLCQPPPTAYLTASGAASEVRSLLMHPCPPPPPPLSASSPGNGRGCPGQGLNWTFPPPMASFEWGGGGMGGLRPKSLCAKNGPTRFPQR